MILEANGVVTGLKSIMLQLHSTSFADANSVIHKGTVNYAAVVHYTGYADAKITN